MTPPPAFPATSTFARKRGSTPARAAARRWICWPARRTPTCRFSLWKLARDDGKVVVGGWDGEPHYGEGRTIFTEDFGDRDFERIDVFTFGSPETLEPSSAQDDLGRAVRAGDAAGVRAALAGGADPDLMPDDPRRPMAVALGLGNAGTMYNWSYELISRQQQLDTIRALADGGATLDSPDDEPSVVMALAKCERVDDRTIVALLRLLLDCGADPNAPGTSFRTRGATPLQMVAVALGGPAVAKLLLSRGADPSRVNSRGVTAPALALEKLADRRERPRNEEPYEIERLEQIVAVFEQHAAGTLDVGDIDELAEASWRRWLAKHEGWKRQSKAASPELWREHHGEDA